MALLNPEVVKVAVKNWRTTVAGCVTALMAVPYGLLQILDGDPATNPDYTLILALIVGAIGLIRARDDVVTADTLREEGVLP